MKFLGYVVVIIAVLLGAAAGLYGYMGGFQAVRIGKETFGPAEIAYSTHVGPYRKLGESWGGFLAAWDKIGVGPCDSLGVYLDPPSTPEDKLRTVIACRIDALSEEDKAKVRAALPGFVIPQSEALTASFPFRNDLSFFLAPMKVYPEVQRVMEKEGLSAAVGIELYGETGKIKEISFIIPVGVTQADYQALIDAF